MKTSYTAATALLLSILSSGPLSAAPCPFNNQLNCTVAKDILNDRAPNGLRYYAPTNYDHRKSGEIGVFDATLVTPYTDGVNAPGQLKLTAKRINAGFFKSGEIMTRVNLDKPPYNAPTKSVPYTTNDIKHGYFEARVKLPKCDTSDDGLCQNNKAPQSYTRGLWPSVWLLPTKDTPWPSNGEIDIFEAYKKSEGINVGTAALHFNGNDPRCGGNDCKGIGMHLPFAVTSGPLYETFHTWGFEWQPDPQSNRGGVIMTGYFDNKKQWGPIRTETLPGDGPAAMARGFSDPNGGFYLIAALAVGGPYSGAPNAHMQTATMYVQSIKAYSVGGVTPPVGTCLPPANIKATITANKKQATLTWDAPVNSDPISNYQVNDWLNRVMWKGAAKKFVDASLPGTNGKFTYFLYSNCGAKMSKGVQYDLMIK
ncbi:MAG: glycoside hydrolase family 16 protein [Gammaproteobacteria bacterium]|nr:glycoside hydrolase family 16 protein [Gammaproteobacteria bacterium]